MTQRVKKNKCCATDGISPYNRSDKQYCIDTGYRTRALYPFLLL